MIDAHIHFHKQPYSLETIDNMVKTAMSRNINEIHLLDHTHKFSEFDFLYEKCINEIETYERYSKKGKNISIENYISFIKEVRKHNYPIVIKFGLEVCYFPDMDDEIKLVLDKYKDIFDFYIGSVHHINGFGYDVNKDLWISRDVDDLYKNYYLITEKLIKSRLFSHLGHPDAIKIFNYFPSYDLTKTYNRIAILLKEYNMTTEDNYGFIRYGYSNYGLNLKFKEILEDNNIVIYKSSDAHEHKDIGRFSIE